MDTKTTTHYFNPAVTFLCPESWRIVQDVDIVSLNYFTMEQNLIKPINGGYEDLVSSFMAHSLFSNNSNVYNQHKLYLEPKVTPKCDIFITNPRNRDINFRTYFDGKIVSYIEVGHHFSSKVAEHLNKTLEDLVKWVTIFNQYGFTGEVIAIQYVTHLISVSNSYKQFAMHGMAKTNVKFLPNPYGLNINTINLIYMNLGHLVKHSEVNVKTNDIEFSIHIFVNKFNERIKLNELYQRIDLKYRKLKLILDNPTIWGINKSLGKE